MTEMQQRWSESHHDHHFPCDCGAWHYIDVSVDDMDSEWRYLEIAEAIQPVSVKEKLKAVWTILRGRTHYHSGILLDEANTRDLKKVVDGLVEMYDA